MNFRQMMANYHPNLKAKYDSKQHLLSKDVIGRKLSLKVDQLTMALLMEVSYDKYLKMENGSMDIPVEDYKEALEKVSDLTHYRTETDFNVKKVTSQFSSYIIKLAVDQYRLNVGDISNNHHHSLDNLNLNLKQKTSEERVFKNTEHISKLVGEEIMISLNRKKITEDDSSVSVMDNELKGYHIKVDNKKTIELDGKYLEKISLSA